MPMAGEAAFIDVPAKGFAPSPSTAEDLVSEGERVAVPESRRGVRWRRHHRRVVPSSASPQVLVRGSSVSTHPGTIQRLVLVVERDWVGLVGS